jgi:hypothetical protein
VALIPLSLRNIAGFRILESTGYGGCGGMLFEDGVDESDKNKIIDIIKRRIAAFLTDYKVTSFDILSSSIYNHDNAMYDIGRGRTRVSKEAVSIIDLSKPETLIWRDLKSGCRQAIRKAEKNGLNVIKAEGYSDIEEFYGFILQRYATTGAKIIPYKYFSFLWERWGKKNDILNLFFIQKEGKNIGGILIAKFKDVVTFLNMSCEAKMFYLRPNNLLIWHVIKWAKECRCRWYEVNRIYLKDRESKKARLGYFFKGFSDDIVYRDRISVVAAPFRFTCYLLLRHASAFLMPNK